MKTKNPPRPLLEGKAGEVWLFVRPSGRCPAEEFLGGAPKRLRKRFQRMFDRFGEVGMSAACNSYFKPLSDKGKGLWVFKEFDHRVFAVQVPSPGGKERVALLSGWVKDRSLCLEERNQIARAMNLRQECLALNWGGVVAQRAQEAQEEKEVTAVSVSEAETTPVEGSKKEDLVDMKRLAEMLNVNYYTFANWCTKGLMDPPGEKKGTRRVWKWSEIDAVEQCVRRLEAKPKSRAKRGESPSPAVVPLLAPETPTEPPRLEVMTRPDLLTLARDVIDGHKQAGYFIAELVKYRARYEQVLKELKDLEQEMSKLTQGTPPEEGSG